MIQFLEHFVSKCPSNDFMMIFQTNFNQDIAFMEIEGVKIDNKFLKSLSTVRSPLKTELLEDLEKEFGLEFTENITEKQRRQNILNAKTELTGVDQKLREEIKEEIDINWQRTSEEELIGALKINELNNVYQEFDFQLFEPLNLNKNIRFVDAVSEGLKQSMEKHDNLVIMGQDVAEYGGVFKITDGFVAEFGKERVRNTPICESAIVSTAMGLSINGMKAVVEMQFADFVSSGFNPIVNYLAKVHYRWNESADVVIRMPCGAGVGAGPFHSQTNEAWFTKTPGLKVVYPAFPHDAKGLLISAVNDPNPVLFFEHKALYRSIYGDVPTNYYSIPFGKAALLKNGKDVTIITYGAGVHWALETLGKHTGINADLIDLRSLQPLDTESIYQSVQKTGKAIVLQEDTMFGGIASDIAALVMENCFEYLDAPIKRVGSLDTPVPFAKALEDQFLPKNRFEEELLELLAY